MLYKELIVWQKSMLLVKEIYLLTKDFPRDEQFGLISQMRRAAVSIPSNVAEGRRWGTQKEFAQFLRQAFGSGSELETQLEIAKSIGYGKIEFIEKCQKLLDEVMRMLNKMITTTSNKN